MELIYDKLVWDNIPGIIECDGEIAIYHQLDDKEYLIRLLEKDQEELLEVKNAPSIEEIKKFEIAFDVVP